MTDTVGENIARRLVKAALVAGYSVSVNDGGDWVIIRSTDQKAIIDAMFSVDEERLVFRWPDGTYIGSAWLIYGNGEEVISDHTDTLLVNNLVDKAIPI